MEKDSQIGGIERLPRADAGKHLLDECRMVLPGIQALFGFQMMVVFNEGFSTELESTERWLHLAALLLVATAMGFLMAPAAYHRQTSPEHITEHFLQLGSRLIMLGMFPLAFGVSLDVYLVARVITESPTLSAILALALLAFLFGLWLALPWIRRLRMRGQALP